MSRLPQGADLHVGEKKVVEYLLNRDHAEGGPKAKFFRNRGFAPENWEFFAEALREHGRVNEIAEEEETRHGRKFEVQCVIVTPDSKNPCILTVWIKSGDAPPRLVTAHPNT